jgi:tight adherence protein B
MTMQALALAFLAATAIGGLAWVFLYPTLSGEKKAEHRRASLARPEPAARNVDKNQRSRREQVEGTLKELDARRQKEKKIALSTRLTQAGLDWSTQKFMIMSGVLGAAAFALAIFAGGGLLGAAGLAFAAGLGPELSQEAPGEGFSEGAAGRRRRDRPRHQGRPAAV